VVCSVAGNGLALWRRARLDRSWTGQRWLMQERGDARLAIDPLVGQDAVELRSRSSRRLSPNQSSVRARSIAPWRPTVAVAKSPRS